MTDTFNPFPHLPQKIRKPENSLRSSQNLSPRGWEVDLIVYLNSLGSSWTISHHLEIILDLVSVHLPQCILTAALPVKFMRCINWIIVHLEGWVEMPTVGKYKTVVGRSVTTSLGQLLRCHKWKSSSVSSWSRNKYLFIAWNKLNASLNLPLNQPNELLTFLDGYNLFL